MHRLVAPFTGAWIEIPWKTNFDEMAKVAPFTGAWIEIPMVLPSCVCTVGRTLHGCVD